MGQRDVKQPVGMFAVSLCLALGCTTAALANPCVGDIATLCPNVPAGEGRIAACLRAHAPALSSACTFRMAELQTQLQGMHQACEDDIAVFCPGVPPGDGRIAECLKANGPRLSIMCRSAIIGNVP